MKIKRRGKKWSTEFSQEDVLKMFTEVGPVRSIYYSGMYSLAWLIEKIFRNQQGKPLKLEAFQMVVLDMLWHKKFPMVIATRGAGKTFILALYCLLRALLVPGSKIIIVGAGFRQAKFVFKYIEQLYEASPVVKEALSQWGGPKYGSDAATFRVGLSSIKAIPIGDGEKIRGERATVLIADEFSSISEEIFDIVIKPFTAVHANPAERAMIARFVKRLKEMNAPPEVLKLIEETQDFGNQIVVSGTPSYKHNHFYKRYHLYRAFIASKGDPQRLKATLEQRALETTGKSQMISSEDITRMCSTWKHYAILQLPYTGLPEGFLDEDNIRSDRAAFPRHRFMMEYEATFPDDSDGFIKRSWIEQATPRAPESTPVEVELYGDPRAVYVMGLDPARWNDNFGCVVLKLTPRGKELVYCNAWDRTDFSKSAEKIREICSRFNIQYIAMDKGGGGDSVLEWLSKPGLDGNEERLLWPVPDHIIDKRILSQPGKKIVELVNFSPQWISEAAHSVEAAIQQCNVLYPYRADENAIYNQYSRHFNKNDALSNREKELLCYDAWGMDEWEASKLSKELGQKFEAQFGIYSHIEECKNETCAIVRYVTANGVEKFELPTLSEQPEGLDMRRRDRWSALMLANYAARVYLGSVNKPQGSLHNNGYKKSYTRGSYRRKGSVGY